MKHLWQSLKAELLIFLLSLSFLTPAAYAVDPLYVEIPFSIHLSGDVPEKDEIFTILLEAETDMAPMPSGSVGNSYFATVSGAGDFQFPAICYSRVGVYSYQVREQAGSNPLCIYDTTLYHVTVFITNRSDAKGLEATVVVSQDGFPQNKCDLSFENHYHSPDTPISLSVIKKWVDCGTNRPDAITVQLLQDGAVYDSVELCDSNGWQHAWEGLSGKHQWSVTEPNVPDGYTVSYDFENGLYTITNTSTLIQTGQMRWPIWVLSGLGIFSIVLGICLFVKQKDENA